MNKLDTLNKLNKIASVLENNGNVKEAEILTDVMVKISQNTPSDHSGKHTLPTYPYMTLINHYKGLMARNDNAAKVEMKAIMDKLSSGYGYTPAQVNAFREQVVRAGEFSNQANIDDVMAKIFKKWMPSGVTAQGIRNNQTNIENDANQAGVGRIDEYIRRTLQMLDSKQPKYKTSPTGGVTQQPSFGAPNQ
jgi:hypothetical protein